jgi:hypothetical protein
MKRSVLIFLVMLGVIPIYIGVIITQDMLVSYSFQAQGSSIAAEVAREVYAITYNKRRANELIPGILTCVDDVACISQEVGKLDRHMLVTDVDDSELADVFINENHKITFSQKSPDVLYAQLRSFHFDFPPGIDSLVPSDFISVSNFLLGAKSTQSVIIDLRYNTGGKTWIALALASMFIPSGNSIPVHYNPSWKFHYVQSLTLPRIFTERGIRGLIAGSMYLPSSTKPQVKAVYIVVNEHTASAAEFFGIVLERLSNQKIVFVGDSESRGVGNTINFPTKKYRIMVTAGIIRQYPEKIVPEMTIAELENELGITLDN